MKLWSSRTEPRRERKKRKKLSNTKIIWKRQPIAARLAQRQRELAMEIENITQTGGRRRDWQRGETGRTTEGGEREVHGGWGSMHPQCMGAACRLHASFLKMTRNCGSRRKWVGCCIFYQARVCLVKQEPLQPPFHSSPVTTHLHTRIHGAMLKQVFNIRGVSRRLADVGCTLHMCCKPWVAAVSGWS